MGSSMCKTESSLRGGSDICHRWVPNGEDDRKPAGGMQQDVRKTPLHSLTLVDTRRRAMEQKEQDRAGSMRPGKKKHKLLVEVNDDQTKKMRVILDRGCLVRDLQAAVQERLRKKQKTEGGGYPIVKEMCERPNTVRGGGGAAATGGRVSSSSTSAASQEPLELDSDDALSDILGSDAEGDTTFVAMVQGEGGGAAAAGSPAAMAGPSGAAPASGSPAAAIATSSTSASAAAGVESEKGEAVGVDPKSGPESFVVNRTHLRTERANTPQAHTTLSPRTGYTSAAAVITPADGQQTDGAVVPSAAAAVTVPRGETAANEEAEATLAAMKEFVAPASHELLPKPARASSPIWNYGVKVKDRSSGKWAFACFGSTVCRARSKNGVFIGISKRSGSNALDHVKHKHGAGPSTNTKSAQAMADLRAQKPSPFTRIFDNELSRALKWVQRHVIECCSPLTLGETEGVKTNVLLPARGFDPSRIRRQEVKKVVVECYAATAARFKKEMATEVAGVPCLHLCLELWVDKSSSLKYMGVRLFYVNSVWQLKSYLLAVRQFNPTPETLKNERLSELLEKYVFAVLEEFGVDASLLFSATSDAGGDVKRLCSVLLPGLREWCVCHMLNDSLAEAIGTCVDPQKPGDRPARNVVMAVKKAVERVRKSPAAKDIFTEEQVLHFSQCSNRKVVNAAPQRWSGVTGVLEAAVTNRAAINGVYAEEGKDSPLSPHVHEIDELYSLIQPVAEVIATCQQTHVPTGQAAVLGLAALKLSTLNADAPLDILTPASKPTQGATEGAGGEQRTTARAHNDLTRVGREAREHLASALHWRDFDKRYKSTVSESTDLVFDVQMGLHPCTADLQYVSRLAPTEGHAAAVKKSITDKIIALAVELADKEAERKGIEAEHGEPAAKRAPQASAPGNTYPMFGSARYHKEATTTAIMAGLGLIATRDDETNASPIERARAELETLRSSEEDALFGDTSCERVLTWWKRKEHSFPLLARAARVVFAAPASVMVQERDLSSAGRMMTSSRSTGDAEHVEMVLFLHGNVDLLPEIIPELPADGVDGVQTKIPGRLSNPMLELHAFDGEFGPVDLTSDDDGEG